MSLTYDTRRCAPITESNDYAIRDTLVMLLMAIGIPEITAKNYPQVYARIHLLEETNGAFMNQITPEGLTPLLFTPAIIKRWIGMTTNADKFSEARFLKKFALSLRTYEREAKGK